MGVLRQKRPVQIRADHIFVKHALCLVLFIVAVSVQYLPKRFVAIDIRPSAMVFKSDDRNFKSIILDHDIRDQARTPLLRVKIHERKSLDPSVIRIVVMTEQLVAAAHCDHTSATLHVIPKALFYPAQLLADQHLLPV